jgi:glycosyltransferase involved in cell wall biosynthesis
MKIAYITPYYPPESKGGGEISLKLLAETLASLGHEIVIFTPNYQNKSKVEGENPKIYRLRFGLDSVFSRTNPLSCRSFVAKILKTDEKFDLIDAYLWYQPAKILSEKLKIPYICSVRDATPICDFRVDVNPKDFPFYEYFSKRFSYGLSFRKIINAIYGYFLTHQNLEIISRASCLTFASKALAKIFKKYNSCGEVINSVGLPVFKKQNVKIPGINFKKDKVVLYAGRLSEGKGAGFLFEAIKRIILKDKSIKFIFIGDGLLMPKISAPRFRDNIFCLGKKPHEFVLNVVRKARITVIPSLIFEGFPRMAVESISLGVPVIGTNVGGVPEAIGEAGVVVEVGNQKMLADEILKFCNNKNTYQKLKDNTKKQAEKFLPEKIASRVIKIYKKVVGL